MTHPHNEACGYQSLKDAVCRLLLHGLQLCLARFGEKAECKVLFLGTTTDLLAPSKELSPLKQYSTLPWSDHCRLEILSTYISELLATIISEQSQKSWHLCRELRGLARKYQASARA